MQQMIYRIRDKYTYWSLLLFAPLEILPFLCEPDSTMGKALLLIKTTLFGILYVFYADKQKWYTHAMLLITCTLMGVSVLKHGGAGTALLILTMFFALITLPKVEIELSKLRLLYLLLACGGAIIIIYGMLRNYYEGLTSFSWRGLYNPNTFGMLLLSMLFYLESALQQRVKWNTIWLDLCFTLSVGYLVIVTNCRGALLSLIVFTLGKAFHGRKTSGKVIFYILAVVSIMTCIVIAIAEQKYAISNAGMDIELAGKKLFSGREKVWSSALNGFNQSPLWGQSSAYLMENTQLASAHSVFMGILVSVGAIPGLFYCILLFSLGEQLNVNHSTNAITINKLSFASSLVIATLECAYTDNRLNMLFLPLLLNGVLYSNNQEPFSEQKEVDCDSVYQNNHQKEMGNKWLKITATSIVAIMLVICLLEPVALSFTHKSLPTKMNQLFFDEIGLDKSNENLIEKRKYPSKTQYGVMWEWNGNGYDVMGTSDKYQFLDFYSSANSMPTWAEVGCTYHLVYESENVRFRLYYYLSDGSFVELVSTTTSVDFIIPKEACGLTVRLSVSEGITVRETVMPIILKKKDEADYIRAKHEPFVNHMNEKYGNEEYEELRQRNVLGNKVYSTIESHGIIWEWNGAEYNVQGTSDRYQFMDLYSSADTMPMWAKAECQYHLIFESEKVRFRLYYYLSDGSFVELVSTTTSVGFIIPKEACGLTVRLAVSEGETIRETVMPIILMEEDELGIQTKQASFTNHMNEKYGNEEYEEQKQRNVLGNKVYSTTESHGIIWEWNGAEYNVQGTSDRYQFMDLYSSADTMPVWVKAECQYHLIYESEKVRFRLYYYLSDGSFVELVSTTTSTDFIIPKEARGLTVRLSVSEGETVRETVMPIILLKDEEIESV